MTRLQKDVLLVEDDNTEATLVVDILKKRGYDIDRVATGEEAFQKLKEYRYRVFLLDFILPDMTGFQVFRGLKNNNDHVEAVSIMVTGSGDEEKAVEFLKDGGDDYIAKVPNKSHLAVLPHVIEEALERRKVMTERERLHTWLEERNARLDKLNRKLQSQVTKLETLFKSSTQQERNMMELKEEINRLLRELGRPVKY